MTTQNADITRFSSCRGVSFEIHTHSSPSQSPPGSTMPTNLPTAGSACHGHWETPSRYSRARGSFRHTREDQRIEVVDILLDQGLFTVYKRLFAVFFTVNMAALVLAIAGNFSYAERKAATFAIYNVLVLTLCRSEAFLRLVFWCSVKALEGLRRGIHSSCGVSSVAWLIYALVRTLKHRHNASPEIIAVASAILSLLFVSCLVSFPLVRHLHHNVFERTHRFAGWTALALLWVFVVLTAGYDPKSESYDKLNASRLAKQQEIWLTLLVTLLTVLHGSPISRSPLSEWHAFAIISDNKEGHMMLAGAVGDFTRGLVSDPPSHLWVRGVHFAGLPYLVHMYNRAVLVATGSGIAVFLSFLLQPCAAEVCVVWVTKSVDQNFGSEIKEMMSGHPAGKVIIHDTAVSGRPNVAELAVETAKKWKAEVVW
ncbi:unnamed protein product [Spirodela intermedia]|uniref:Uncharacterized protein n=1 Tax=Spirodela intermedia TaxID=51605 RepID=A0ABN7EAV4_SPIIN|nr:unnamed protein product [Spirodela intermedia]